MDNWKKVIFSDESRSHISQNEDAGTFGWCYSNETHEDDCPKKTSKFPKLIIIWGCMSFKVPGEMEIISPIINTHVYIEIFDNPA